MDNSKQPPLPIASSDFEDEDEGGRSSKPWDPSKIRVETKHFSLHQIVEEIKEHGIDLAPDFQRDYVWKAEQKTLLIESILIGIPLPAFYFNANQQSQHQVVDGVQRLSTVRDFANGDFVLTDDLEYLKDLKGQRFEDLQPVLKRRFNQTQIVVHVIDASSPADLKYDIFKRINTGGTPLKPQEIRHCMSQRRSRDFLKKLANSQEFLDAVHLNSNTHMEDRELALRFVAFYRFSQADPLLSGYPNDITLDGFLLGTATDLDDKTKISDQSLEEIAAAFQTALLNCSTIFGNQAFRKIRENPSQRARMSRPLFECWTVSTAGLGQISERIAEAIRIDAQRYMSTDLEYMDSYTRATGNPERIRLRFRRTHEIITRAIEAEKCNFI